MNGREIIITGMHGSGVHDVTQFLNNAGIKPIVNDELHEKPSFHSLKTLNHSILESLNSLWDHLDIHKLAQIKEFQIQQGTLQEMESLVQHAFKAEQPFFLADHSFCLTLYYWLQFFKNPTFIICVRNPLEIARSLKIELGFSLPRGLRLWECYTWMLLRFLPQERCIFVYHDEFVADDENSYKQLLSELSSKEINQRIAPNKIESVLSFSTKEDLPSRAGTDLKRLLSSDQMELWEQINVHNPCFEVFKNEASRKERIVSKFIVITKLVKLLGTPKKALAFKKAYETLHSNNAYFSEGFYLRENPDIAQAGIPPLCHYLMSGWLEGRNPNPYFDTNYYLECYPDLHESNINPLYHFIVAGWKEGRNPSPDNISSDILSENPRIIDKEIHLLEHLAKDGKRVKTAYFLNNRILFKKKQYSFQRPVTVIIPVYLSNDDAVTVLNALLESITLSYPKYEECLRFLVIDDASPIRQTITILESTNFLERQDITFIQNEENLGFVKTVNKGFTEVQKNSDIVILNSDTEIHGSVFERLQDLCLRYPKIASVTPLSNRATIACLADWPFGTDSIYGLSAKETSTLVENANLISPNIYTPTGHGFCMYMSCEALQEIASFDEESFSKGYGEENDWSAQTIRKGYKHLISTECYVHHHESKSFNSDQKKVLQSENSIKLSTKHPYYDGWVQHYLKKDPLQYHRKVLQILLLGAVKKKKGYKTICFVLHDSFKNPFGGVQQHIKYLIDTMCQYVEMEVLVVAPNELVGEFYELHFHKGDDNIILEGLDDRSLMNILDKLEDRIDFLHMHNTFGVIEALLNWVCLSGIERKIFTIHDYQLFCENPFLFNLNDRFCKASEDEQQHCRKNCKEFKDKGSSFLSHFDTILVPSENTSKYVNSFIDDDALKQKVVVLPHLVPFYDEVIEKQKVQKIERQQMQSKNIVFLGALYSHKGGELFLSITQQLKEEGFQPQIWGVPQQELLNKFENIPPILAYQNWKGLYELKAQYGVAVVVMPSMCAETFSYTLYEALFLLGVPVVVGDYGHPADVVDKYGVGELAKGNSPAGLLKAVRKITDNYSEYKKRVREFKTQKLNDFSPFTYLEKYFQHLFEKAPVLIENKLKKKPQNEDLTLSRTAQEIMNGGAATTHTNKINVLMVHGLSAENPPYFYRFENPRAFLQNTENHVVTCDLKTIPESIDSFDVVYLSRTPYNSNLCKLLSQANESKIPTILDVDDLIFHTDFIEKFYFLNDSPEKVQEYENLLSKMEVTFNKVDYLFGSTPRIAQMAQKYGKTALYFRNMLRHNYLEVYRKLYSSRPTFKKKIIGYFSGSNTHDKDLEFIKPVLERIFLEDPEVEVMLMGFIESSEFIKKYSYRVTNKPFSNYEDYLETLQSCKVVLTPIAEINNFSDAKSNIKFLEASAVGTPIITSPISEMLNSIDHGSTGWIAESHEDWYKHIKTALTGDFAKYVGESANEYVMKKFVEGSEQFYQILKVIQEKAE